MSEKPSHKALISLVLLTVLASGAAIIWANWNPGTRPTPLDSVAQAAPAPGAPKSLPRPVPAIPSKPATKAERDAVLKVISAQLHAFDTGNWTEAAKYQSAGLKQNFPSAAAFGQMIQRMYPAFVHAQKVTYGHAQNVGGHIQIEVALTRYDGGITKALYSLDKEKPGYRIEAVLGGETPQDENATIT